MATPGHSSDIPSEQRQPRPIESTESSAGTSKGGSRSNSRPGKRLSKGKQKVRFTSKERRAESSEGRRKLDASEATITPTDGQALNSLSLGKYSVEGKDGHRLSKLDLDLVGSQDITDSHERSPIIPFRPATGRAPSSDSSLSDLFMTIPGSRDPVAAAMAKKPAKPDDRRLSRIATTNAAVGSVPPSRSRSISPNLTGSTGNLIDFKSIHLRKLERRKNYSIEDHDDEDERRRLVPSGWSHSVIKAMGKYLGWPKPQGPQTLGQVEAQDTPAPSGQVTPVAERDPNDYVPRPLQYREGYLSARLRHLQEQWARPASLTSIPGGAAALARVDERTDVAEGSSSQPQSPHSSGASTPAPRRPKWYQNQQNQSTPSVRNLISSSIVLAQPGFSGPRESQSSIAPRPGPRPGLRPALRSKSTAALDALTRTFRRRGDESVELRVHLAETFSRQTYLVKLCQALMNYGAPTHRLEEYLRMSARVLGIEGQFFYLPTCMIIAFDDSNTHTTEIKIVRAPYGVDLGKLKDTHEIYKEVVHDLISVDEALPRLDEVFKRPAQYSPRVLIFMYGLCSASVGPFAFGARWIDLPISFALGIIVGLLQLQLSPRSALYTNVFEVTAAVVTSCLARAFGSIRGGDVFCFSALAQSAIVLILPGYTLLCGSLELQSKNIIAGSVRMVYAVIYSLFLGFGITVGITLYGVMDKHATSAATCKNSMSTGLQWMFVPLFTWCLIIVNQGRWKQMFFMIVIAFAGYIVNHYSARYLNSNVQVSQTVAALAIGVMANLYSRLGHGLAATALLPAIFVQVPSGLAAGASLISGLKSANQMNRSSDGTGQTFNVTNPDITGIPDTNIMFMVGYGMIQVAIGITVGLFLSALVVYPFGKKRSGLFSF